MSDAQERRLIAIDNIMVENKLSTISKAFIFGTVTIVVAYIYHPSGINWVKFKDLIRNLDQFSPDNTNE